jgi:Flp pilus assembly protein TadD
VLATSPEALVRNGVRAVELAQEALRLSAGDNPTLIATLAAAYAEAGQFTQAIETARRALQLATAQNRTALGNRVQAEIASYQAGSPYRDTGRSEN